MKLPSGACAILLLASFAQAPSPSRPDVRGDLVTLDVVAVETSGRVRREIRSDDVAVLVDGKAVAIEQLAPAASPLSLFVLIDASNSVSPQTRARGAWFGEVRDVIVQMLSAMQDPDRALVMPLSASAEQVTFSSDSAVLRQQVRSAFERPDRERAGPSPLWDAIASAAGRLREEPGRRAVVAFTDGRATANRLGLGDAADRAAASNVAVYFVTARADYYIRQQDKAAARVRPSIFLEQLADFTGGACIQPERPTNKETTAAFEQVLDHLRGTWTVTFRSPARDGRLHRVEVRPAVPGLTFRCRRAFLAPR